MGTFNFSGTRSLPYIHPDHPLLHLGTVTVTGSLLVNLGIGHNNFIVSPCLNSAAAIDLTDDLNVSWEYASLSGAGPLGSFLLKVESPTLASWSASTPVSSNTTGALPNNGQITAVTLTTGTVTGAGNLRSNAPATTRDVEVTYSALGIPTLTFLAADAVTACVYQQLSNVLDTSARQISFIAVATGSVQ